MKLFLFTVHNGIFHFVEFLFSDHTCIAPLHHSFTQVTFDWRTIRLLLPVDQSFLGTTQCARTSSISSLHGTTSSARSVASSTERYTDIPAH